MHYSPKKRPMKKRQYRISLVAGRALPSFDLTIKPCFLRRAVLSSSIHQVKSCSRSPRDNAATKSNNFFALMEHV
jgi:hypothetical protein